MVAKAKTIEDWKGVSISIGSRVRLDVRHGHPFMGWGKVENGDTGVVRAITGKRKLIIDFPRHPGWMGHSTEVVSLCSELCEQYNTVIQRKEERE